MYCQKCGTQNPEGANNCQNCGAPLNATPAKPKKKKTGLIIGIVAVIAVIAIIGSIGGGGDKKTDTSSSADTSASTSAAVATTEKKADAKFVVKLGETKVIKDYEGKPTLLVNYSFTNNSDKKQSFMVAIKDAAFQDGIGLNDAITMGNEYDSELQMKEIMPGKTLNVQAAYVLDDTTTPVEIQISELISFNDELIDTFTVNLK